MYLLIYACCKESDRQHPDERSVRVEWSEQPPALCDIVSMGKQKCWTIVEIAAYRPVVLGQEVRAVYLAYVQRDGLPLAPKTEWSFFHPQENIHIHLTGIGEPALQLGVNVLGDPPRFGERVTQEAPILPSEPARSEVRTWVIDRYDTYLPEDQPTYSAIYLVWCLVSETSIAG